MKRLLSAALAATMVAGLAGAAVAQDHRDNGPPAGHSNHQAWKKGGRVDHDEWARGQRVDYRSQHLRKPPRGYEWRNVDGDYVLGAVATGVIADLLLNNH